VYSREEKPITARYSLIGTYYRKVFPDWYLIGYGLRIQHQEERNAAKIFTCLIRKNDTKLDSGAINNTTG